MADGKITIDTSIDNAGALKDLKKLTSNVSQQGNAAAGAASSAFSKIGSAAKHSAADRGNGPCRCGDGCRG